MVSSVLGGACVAFACLVIGLLRGGASRTPKPIWARGEWIESTVAVGIVTVLAIGISLVIGAASSGLMAVLVGLSVAVVGSAAAVAIAIRRAATRVREKAA